MQSEFTAINAHWAKHSDGFEVQILNYCDIHYRDQIGNVEFDAEWLEGNGILIYPDSKDTQGFSVRSRSERSKVLDQVVKGFGFLGFTVEIDDL